MYLQFLLDFCCIVSPYVFAWVFIYSFVVLCKQKLINNEGSIGAQWNHECQIDCYEWSWVRVLGPLEQELGSRIITRSTCRHWASSNSIYVLGNCPPLPLLLQEALILHFQLTHIAFSKAIFLEDEEINAMWHFKRLSYCGPLKAKRVGIWKDSLWCCCDDWAKSFTVQAGCANPQLEMWFVG